MTDSEIISKYPRLTKSQVIEIYKQTNEILVSERLTGNDRYVIEQYEGLGSQTQTGKVDKGLLHQFYTPYVITKKMWDLAEHYGFKGGNVLEPAVGTGRFFKFVPKDTNLYAFDPDPVNAKILRKLYPGVTLYEKEFETAWLEQPRLNKLLKKSWLPQMDLVIGNPPYGEYIGYYKTYMQKDFTRFEFLFVYLGLKTLKKDGLLVFIVSQNFMNNGAMYNRMKERILELGSFIDAVRLPNGIFSTTDIGTDLIVFKKLESTNN